MDVYKLKMKIGEHEFEAEGPTDMVQAQFEAFRELVSVTPARPTVTPPPTPGGGAPPPNGDDLKLDKVMRQEGRVVSLTARGANVEDEIMLVLLGQKLMRDNDSVTGAEIIEGLRLTGRTVNRVDYQLDKMTDAGDVITIGVGRARRYRLTNQGLTKGRELARTIIATVA
jgi:hypothetical protein